MDDFEALYEEMLPVVHRYATTRVGTSSGEEICGEVFHAAVVAIRSGRSAEVTAPWLMAVTKNKVIDHWRRQERRSKVSHLFERREIDLREPSAEVEASKQWSDAVQALEQLPDRYRVLLTLRYLDDMSVAELAQHSQQSVAAVESALARARRSFRNLFEAVG